MWEKISKINETKDDRIKKFSKEYEENLKLTKSIKDHKSDLRKISDDLKIYSDDELMEMKVEKIKNYNLENWIEKISFEKKIIKPNWEKILENKKNLEIKKEKKYRIKFTNKIFWKWKRRNKNNLEN